MSYLIVFVFGAIIGSFLNVCIYRIPRGKSIVFPPSSCPSCGKQIEWFDNIPLLSFLVLGAKCRACRAPISLRYFIVELLTALSGILLLCYFPIDTRFFGYWAFVCALIVVVFIDMEHMEIPDVISIPGIFAGLIFSVFFLSGKMSFSSKALLDSFIGIFAGSGSIYLMGVFGEKVFAEKAKEAGGAVGGGDLKLMAMIGAFLGWKLALLTFFLAPLLGSGMGLYAMIKKKEQVIPYGPYLSLAAVVSLLYGKKILEYMFGW